MDFWQAPYSTRRTVYGPIERQNLPGIFKTFDFATPDASSPQRFSTVVPQQALFMMNNDFVVEQAQAVGQSARSHGAKDDAARIRALYQILFRARATAEEIALGQKYLQIGPARRPTSRRSFGAMATAASTKNPIGPRLNRLKFSGTNRIVLAMPFPLMARLVIFR